MSTKERVGEALSDLRSKMTPGARFDQQDMLRGIVDVLELLAGERARVSRPVHRERQTQLRGAMSLPKKWRGMVYRRCMDKMVRWYRDGTGKPRNRALRYRLERRKRRAGRRAAR